MPIKKHKSKQAKKAKIKAEIKSLKNNITKLLDDAKVKYKVLEHKVVFTAHDVGATTKKKLSEIAKVVLVKTEYPSPRHGEGGPKGRERLMNESWALVVLPAGKYIDLKGVKKALKAKKVSIASEKDITKYLKTKVGLLHPFGSEYNIQTLLDKGMSKTKKIIASAGDRKSVV